MSSESLTFVHRFVPASGSARTLLLLHGTGGDENDLLPLGHSLDPRAALLSPRGRVLENGMPRFFRRIAPGVLDVEDLASRSGELADFVAASARHYGFDPGRVIAVGYSNGANIAASLLLLRPGTLSGAVLFRAMMVPAAEPLPDLRGVLVWMGAGRDDPTMPREHPERLASLLRAAGAQVTLRRDARGHSLEAAEIEAAREWLASLGATSFTREA